MDYVLLSANINQCSKHYNPKRSYLLARIAEYADLHKFTTLTQRKEQTMIKFIEKRKIGEYELGIKIMYYTKCSLLLNEDKHCCRCKGVLLIIDLSKSI